MSVAIAIEFLAGRYHATPWDRQVNEGTIEWPPSPWRLLRALVAANYRQRSPLPRADLLALLEPLAEQLPCYQLPPKTEAHTRHYMPIVKEGKPTTTRVLDAFAVMEPGATLRVGWPDVTLSEQQASQLAQLCQTVSYLGRAESWAELRLDTATGADWNARPLEAAASQDGAAIAKLLAPLPAAEFAGFRAALAAIPQPRQRSKRWTVPQDLLDVLELDIGDLHRQGWSEVPGARWVRYAVRAPKSERHPREQSAIAPLDSTNFACYALASAVLPNLTEALSLGDRVRQALMKWSGELAGTQVAEPVFVGREGDREATGHEHAWYLPEDADGDGRIDRLVVYARQGFGSAAALQALTRLQRLWGRDQHDIQTVLVALGDRQQLSPTASSSILGCATTWCSLTPMVLSRFPRVNKRREPRLLSTAPGFQIEGPEQQAIALLQKSWGLACCEAGQWAEAEANGLWLVWQDADGRELVRVRQFSPAEERDRQLARFPWYRFQRQRWRPDGSPAGGRRGDGRGYWLWLEFPEPVRGPIALGYGAHFGLGLFRPVGLD